MAANSRSSRSAEADQARIEDAVQLAGLSAAFSEGATLWPQIANLQQTLLAGMVRSQQREAERLNALYAERDPRVVRATERAQNLQEVQSAVDTHAAQVSRFAEASQRDGAFHGYIVQQDGTPAEGYWVRAEVKGATQKETRRGRAKTDAAAYFRIDLGRGKQGAPQSAETLQGWAEKLALSNAEAVAPPASGDAAQAGAVPAGSANVVIVNSAGRTVFTDPFPPTFEVMRSEFRYYVLSATSPGQPVRKNKR